MFKRSRAKIVAAIMSILVLLWVGTLGVIYASSFIEMTRQNEQMLRTHAQNYSLSGDFTQAPPPRPEGFRGMNPESPMFRLSTFYTVALSETGKVLEIKNEPPTVHTDAELEALARRITDGKRAQGRVENLAFYKSDKEGYTLVTFLDNTVIHQRARTLFRYTLIFGGAALVVFFFLSVFLARKIVQPLEENYQKQKQFISDAGHELKTPLSVVSANAELLSREVGNNQWLQNIQYENGRMATLVGQLLELARAESVTPRPEPLDFSRLVAGETLPFESVAFEKGLSLCSDIGTDISVAGEDTRLRQVVSVLLDNAIRHSSAGTVHLRLIREHAHAVLTVTNEGDEIPEEQKSRLFERFYRADPARNGEDRHYGLGLAIAKSIVTAHKGQISVDCHDGLVEFKVKIPAL